MECSKKKTQECREEPRKARRRTQPARLAPSGAYISLTIRLLVFTFADVVSLSARATTKRNIEKCHCRYTAFLTVNLFLSFIYELTYWWWCCWSLSDPQRWCPGRPCGSHPREPWVLPSGWQSGLPGCTLLTLLGLPAPPARFCSGSHFVEFASVLLLSQGH